MTYVVTDHTGARPRIVNADFYNYWGDRPFATFWKNVRGKDVPVATVRVQATTSIRPR